MKWMAAMGKIEQIILHCKNAATPLPLFLSLETGKTARQVPVFFFFQNLRGRWDLAKFGYRSGQGG
jgi:hypothetical protein